MSSDEDSDSDLERDGWDVRPGFVAFLLYLGMAAVLAPLAFLPPLLAARCHKNIRITAWNGAWDGPCQPGVSGRLVVSSLGLAAQ